MKILSVITYFILFSSTLLASNNTEEVQLRQQNINNSSVLEGSFGSVLDQNTGEWKHRFPNGLSENETSQLFEELIKLVKVENSSAMNDRLAKKYFGPGGYAGNVDDALRERYLTEVISELFEEAPRLLGPLQADTLTYMVENKIPIELNLGGRNSGGFPGNIEIDVDSLKYLKENGISSRSGFQTLVHESGHHFDHYGLLAKGHPKVENIEKQAGYQESPRHLYDEMRQNMRALENTSASGVMGLYDDAYKETKSTYSAAVEEMESMLPREIVNDLKSNVVFEALQKITNNIGDQRPRFTAEFAETMTEFYVGAAIGSGNAPHWEDIMTRGSGNINIDDAEGNSKTPSLVNSENVPASDTPTRYSTTRYIDDAEEIGGAVPRGVLQPQVRPHLSDFVPAGIDPKSSEVQRLWESISNKITFSVEESTLDYQQRIQAMGHESVNDFTEKARLQMELDLKSGPPIHPVRMEVLNHLASPKTPGIVFHVGELEGFVEYAEGSKNSFIYLDPSNFLENPIDPFTSVTNPSLDKRSLNLLVHEGGHHYDFYEMERLPGAEGLKQVHNNLGAYNDSASSIYTELRQHLREANGDYLKANASYGLRNPRYMDVLVANGYKVTEINRAGQALQLILTKQGASPPEQLDELKALYIAMEDMALKTPKAHISDPVAQKELFKRLEDAKAGSLKATLALAEGYDPELHIPKEDAQRLHTAEADFKDAQLVNTEKINDAKFNGGSLTNVDSPLKDVAKVSAEKCAEVAKKIPDIAKASMGSRILSKLRNIGKVCKQIPLFGSAVGIPLDTLSPMEHTKKMYKEHTGKELEGFAARFSVACAWNVASEVPLANIYTSYYDGTEMSDMVFPGMSDEDLSHIIRMNNTRPSLDVYTEGGDLLPSFSDEGVSEACNAPARVPYEPRGSLGATQDPANAKPIIRPVLVCEKTTRDLGCVQVYQGGGRIICRAPICYLREVE